MTTNAALVHWCTTCEDDVAFEQPGCADDHGTDCPEWVCVRCGDAVLIGFSPLEGMLRREVDLALDAAPVAGATRRARPRRDHVA